MKFSANVSIMYSEIPFLDRFAAARRAGYRDVECWWPFADAVPTSSERNQFVSAIDAAQVRLRGLNFYAGDMASGDRGIISHPEAADTFSQNIAAVRAIAEETGCTVFNALYGTRLPHVSPETQNVAAVVALQHAASELSDLDPTILVEPLTHGENGDYPLETIDDALHVIDRTDSHSIRLLFDAYHLHNNGTDIVTGVTKHADRIGHIQIADSPGRGRPGTGSIDFGTFFAAVERSGYTGFIGCEYKEPVPSGLPSQSIVSD